MIKKLDKESNQSDIINKINEIVGIVNSMPSSLYTTPPPSPYDLNAVSKLIKRKLK